MTGLIEHGFWRSLLGVLAALGIACSSAVCAQPPATAGRPARVATAMQDLLDYARSQNTTGFLIVRHGQTLVERNWPAPANDRTFLSFAYERNADGALLEDVASQQKSFVAVLLAIAQDKRLIDVSKPVSHYLGAGWSKAAPAQERGITVLHVLTMSSGLDERFAFAAPAGSTFFYNTPVYATTKRILTAAVKRSLDDLTRDWLTDPLGMRDTGWRQRPSALADVGNATGLVTSPRDIARFGAMILHRGLGPDGRRIVSEQAIRAMLEPSATNPAYGRLWWLNGSAFTARAGGGRKAGPLIATAPPDTVAALGALDRRLYIVPSLDLVVVRTGSAAPDKDLDDQLWSRLIKLPSLQ
ncbi:serine hydrolase [Novosphingobium sp. 9U]|uniref:serine hydrolase domain-containing protein n=1 Tax=Novosphingobium sp. 9U TaxID=2653158 RepID=UPI0012F3A9F0|nr:serine hydrolase [Novosphingobium sp. 9U]VWX55060.1 CubicO group peptidase, beta-lactamase class C family [Novosphingobium sp. 9U]